MEKQRGVFRPYKPVGRSDRTAGDSLRHRQKVRDAIKGSIADILSEEAIIGKSGDRIVKVPIRGIKEYRFVYGDNTPGAATGDGDTQPGQIVGKANKKGDGAPDKAGDQPRTDYYETDITLDELIEIMFDDLELPDLERKKLREIPVETLRKPKGTKRKGIQVRLKRFASARERVKRIVGDKRSADELAKNLKELRDQEQELRAVGNNTEADIKHQEADALLLRWQEKQVKLSGYYDSRHHPERLSGAEQKNARVPFIEQDLRYSRQATDTRFESNAVVFCIMDTSGSMDTMKKYLARVFFFLVYQFVRSKYKNVEVVFIAHHTEAKEVTEEEFFHKGESGGTFISSAYAKTLEVINDRYHSALWNIYAFHCSDGDNFGHDNARAIALAKELAATTNLFGYAEIKPLGSRYYESSMLNILKEGVSAGNFNTALIEKKEDIWPSFKDMLSKEK